MKFLDFQMISIGSPVKDLSYCLYSGASKESLDKLDDLLNTYMTSFNDTLERLNCKPENPYTMEKLKNEWKKLSLFGFYMTLGVLRMKLAGEKNIPQISDLDNTKKEGMTLPSVADEHIDVYFKRMKDLMRHVCENRFF